MNRSPFIEDPSPSSEPGIVAIPHVVAWNLTERCNLACGHCYISAGPYRPTDGELTTDECRRIADEILAINPGAMFVLSGGEPLVRNDLEDIARHAHDGGATVVVGTNGTGLSQRRIASLQAAGVTGIAVSIDSLDPDRHNQFRHGTAALEQTMAAVARLQEAGLDFIVQTTLTADNRPELRELVAWAGSWGAVSFNLYFLVETGRGAQMQGLSPADNDAVLTELVDLEREWRGRMLIRSKCQPQIMRHVHEHEPDSPLHNYATRCPCGVQYCRITPEGKVTPCPYLPLEAGDLRTQSFAEIWNHSPVFMGIRNGELRGKCGNCAYRKVCGGCRARAYADTGEVMEADMSCVYVPVGIETAIPAARGVTYGTPHTPVLQWSEAASARMNRIPSFVRGVVTKRVEDYAKANAIHVIDVDLLDEMRSQMPVDFSKRRPFFLRGKDND